MKKVKNDIIKKYSYKDYVIYIKENEKSYESYLQNEQYGIITLMFGVDKKRCSFKEFVNLIEKHIEDYIYIYIKDYEEDYED